MEFHGTTIEHDGCPWSFTFFTFLPHWNGVYITMENVCYGDLVGFYVKYSMQFP